MKLEVFRADTKASDGITSGDLATIAADWTPATPCPNVIGHPKTEDLAHGAVRAFEVQGNALVADIDEKAPAFSKIVEGIRGSTILNRSMAFFDRNHRSNPKPGKIWPKHLGFLGAASPGIGGMPALSAALAFAEGDGDALEVTGEAAPAVLVSPPASGVIRFTEADPAPSTGGATMATEAEIAERERRAEEREKAAEEREKQFAAREKSAREASNVSTVDQLIASKKVLPADKDDLVQAFNAIDGGDTLTFADKSTGTPVSRIAAIMAKGGNVGPASGGDRLSPGGEPDDGTREFAEADDRAGAGSAADYEKALAERNAKLRK